MNWCCEQREALDCLQFVHYFLQWLNWVRPGVVGGSASSQARISQHSSRDTGNPAWAEHYSCDGAMTLSANHSSCILFTNAFNSVLLTNFWSADPHSWNHKGCWEAVSRPRCLLCVHWLGGKWLYPNEGSSLISTDASLKKCSSQARLPGSLKLCAERPSLVRMWWCGLVNWRKVGSPAMMQHVWSAEKCRLTESLDSRSEDSCSEFERKV